MDVTSITGGIQPQKNNGVERNAPARLREVVDRIARESDKVLEGQSTAARLQARETGFRQVSVNLARAGTLAQRADEGVRQIRDEVEKLRTADDGETRRVRDNVDRIARETTFESRPLLDGSREKISLEETISGSGGSKDDVTLSLPDLSSRSLLDEPSRPVRVDDALRRLDGVSSGIDDFRKSVEIVSASIQTVAANQQAAQSELRDSDFDIDPLREIRENREAAIGAQARNINPALVKLVS